MKETIEKWEHSDLTKLHFYSKRVLYNSKMPKELLGENLFVLYEDEPVKKPKGGYDVWLINIHLFLVGC